MTAPVYRCVFSATAFLTVPIALTNMDVVRFIFIGTGGLGDLSPWILSRDLDPSGRGLNLVYIIEPRLIYYRKWSWARRRYPGRGYTPTSK